MSSTTYLMEDPRETARLRRKVDADAWVRRYLETLVPPVGDVLEVGCGPGSLTIATARAHGKTRVTGIDLSAVRFSDAMSEAPGNLILCEADAHHLPFPANSFDFIYSRFVLEYLHDKACAVREMVRVLRPGGRLLLQDLDGQLVWHYPEDEELQAGVTRVLQGLKSQGFDPFVGRRLFSLLNSQGMEDIKTAAETYHLYAGAIDPVNYELWETKLDIVLPAAAKILGEFGEALALKKRFLGYLQRQDTLTYSVVFTVVGRKPAVDDPESE